MSEPVKREDEFQKNKHVRVLERKLEEARRLFGTVFDFGPFPMWISDDQGTCLKLNEALRRTWGVSDEDVVGKYNMFEDPVVKEQGALPLIESVFNNGESVTFRINYDPAQFKALTGASRDTVSVIEATISAIKNTGGKVTNAIVIHKDLTDRKLAEEARERAVNKLKQAQKMEAIGLLAAGVAHEINQPLTFIKAIFECTLHDIEQQKLDIRELASECREAVHQVNRISRIISHLRIFGRAEDMSFKDCQLDTVLDNALILIGPQLQMNHITLHRDIPETLPDVPCDAHRIEQVFINLFQNAIGALESVKEKHITITIVARDDLLILCFNDNGTGIPPDIQSRIFEPFVTTKEVGEGAGLGLSIVYGIIKEHQGDIQYYAEEVGSTFVITLPVSRKE